MPTRGPKFIRPPELAATPATPPALPGLLPPVPDENRLCGEFLEWWFDLKCSKAGCGRVCGYPLKLLARRRYCTADSSVGLIARRFRCEVCGSAPGRVMLAERIDRMPGTSHGGGPDSAFIDLSCMIVERLP